MTIFSIFCGILLGVFIGYQWAKPKGKNTKDKYIRRGLYNRDFSLNNPDGVKIETISVVFEIGEIESTDTLSKVKVLNLKTNKSEYNKNDHNKQKLKDMIDQSWIDSKDIQWITSIAQIRNDKIDEILG